MDIATPRNGYEIANAGGRPIESVTAFRKSMNDALRKTVTIPRFIKVIEMALTQAEEGDHRAREWLTPWILGKVADKVEVSYDADNPPKLVIEIEHVIDKRRQLEAAKAEKEQVDPYAKVREYNAMVQAERAAAIEGQCTTIDDEPT